MSEIVFCSVVKDRTRELKKVVRQHAPHADRSIIVSHRRNQENEDFLASQECKDMNVEWCILDVPYHPPTMRNAYLHRLPPGAWAIHMDCDEFLEEAACYQLRSIAQQAEKQGLNRLGFQAHDIRVGLDGKVWDNLCDHYNPAMFKASAGTCWSGETHGGIHTPGVPVLMGRTPYKYFHIKTSASEFLRGCHNYMSTGQCAQNNTDVPEWREFKKICAVNNLSDFQSLYLAMVGGKLPADLVDWMVANRNNENPEARSWFVVYLGLMHPELNIYMAGNKDLPYDKDRKPYSGEMTF